MRSSHSVMGAHVAVPTTDLTIPGPDSPLRARHYLPSKPAPAPLLVFFHGGGFVVGDIESHDGLCRTICRDAGIHVLSVDYRLAPEHKAPAAVDDCVAAYRWALEHAAELDADPNHIGVGGDSAGGNLAALVALRSRDEGIRQPALQALLYPGLDLSAKTRSRTLFSDGFLLSKQDMDWFTKLYLEGAGIAADDPRVSPLKAADLSGLAPALVLTAGFDPLRDEGNAYAAALRSAGVSVDHRQFDALPHGFASRGDHLGHSSPPQPRLRLHPVRRTFVAHSTICPKVRSPVGGRVARDDTGHVNVVGQSLYQHGVPATHPSNVGARNSACVAWPNKVFRVTVTNGSA
jgi:acetyl esterase